MEAVFNTACIVVIYTLLQNVNAKIVLFLSTSEMC